MDGGVLDIVQVILKIKEMKELNKTIEEQVKIQECKRYLEKDLVKILKDSGYHSEEWEETDPEKEWLIMQSAVVEDDEIIEEAIKQKSLSIYIHNKWWHISNLLIFDIDEEQEIYDDRNINYKTSISQFSIQHLYDFNEFRNDHQLYDQIKDVSINAYSKELEQEIRDDINMDCDAAFSQRSLYNFNSSDEFGGDHYQHDVTKQQHSLDDGSDSDSEC
ncbi:21264_t:CDS:2 [Rhizophagus irregularis]|nr:21264_t:CDS:2 [Rhizophagus irregularis]